MKSKGAGNRRRAIVHWGIELVVVFFGVYAAFLLTELRERRQVEAQRTQIIAALYTEIEEVMGRADRAAGGLTRMVAYYDSTIAAGEMPPLLPMIEPVRAESHMWQATLQMGGLDILDVSTMYEISRFYNVLNAGFEQLAQIRELSENMIIPNLDQGPEAFYNTETGRLLKKYEWYLEGLRSIANLSLEVKAVGDAVLQELEGIK